jgi:hypothetical protein
MKFGEYGIKILFIILLFISGAAFYSLGWIGILVPISAFTLFFIMGLYATFSRILMHSSYYFGLSMIVSIIVFGSLLFFPAQTFWIALIVFGLLIISIIIAIFRYYNGVLGRIQLHRWLS